MHSYHTADRPIAAFHVRGGDKIKEVRGVRAM